MSSDAHWAIAEQAGDAAKRLAGIEEGVDALVENMHSAENEMARQTVALLAIKMLDQSEGWEDAVFKAVAVYRDIKEYELWD